MKWINHLFRFSTSLTMRFTPWIRSGFSVTRSKLCLHRHPVDSLHSVMLCQRNCNRFNKMYYYYQPSHTDYVITVSVHSLIQQDDSSLTHCQADCQLTSWIQQGNSPHLPYGVTVDGQLISLIGQGDSSHHSHGVTVSELMASCFSHLSLIVDGAISSA